MKPSLRWTSLGQGTAWSEVPWPIAFFDENCTFLKKSAFFCCRSGFDQDGNRNGFEANLDTRIFHGGYEFKVAPAYRDDDCSFSAPSSCRWCCHRLFLQDLFTLIQSYSTILEHIQNKVAATCFVQTNA